MDLGECDTRFRFLIRDGIDMSPVGHPDAGRRVVTLEP
jgi:hypothetical protein